MAESDSSGTITARYFYDDSEQIVAMEKAGQRYYYQKNARGDVISLTDSQGNIVNTYSYDPWGNPLTTSETIENPYRYAGYRYDSDTGLYYLRARYYDPQTMRFMTKDPHPGDTKNPLSMNLKRPGLDGGFSPCVQRQLPFPGPTLLLPSFDCYNWNR